MHSDKDFVVELIADDGRSTAICKNKCNIRELWNLINEHFNLNILIIKITFKGQEIDIDSII